MRRADRLFQIIQLLRAGQPGKVVTAATLAQTLEVSERTIYRDIADLQSNRVPIDGEAGLGYMLRAGYDLPPLMFSLEELSALLMGARLLSTFGGKKMASATANAMDKIENVLPDDLKQLSSSLPVYAFQPLSSTGVKAILDTCNDAITASEVLDISYTDAQGKISQRQIEPIGLMFWGRAWTLVAWCRIRDDFRSFRPDRILSVTQSGETFVTDETKTIEAWLHTHSQAEERAIPPQLLDQMSKDKRS